MKNKRFLLIFVLFLSSVVVISGCSSDGEKSVSTSSYNISGLVEDQAGQGLEDITISYSGSEVNGSTQTAADGSWQLIGLKGSVTITPAGEGYIFDPVKLIQNNEARDLKFLASRIDMEKEELLRQSVNPSSQETTVEYRDAVKVIIPGGLLSAAETVVISSLLSYPLLPENDGLIALYDIEIGDLKSFSEEVIIEFSYDPDDIPEDMLASDVLTAVHWDEKNNIWEGKALSVDQENSTVSIYTDELSPVGLFMKSTLKIKNSEHFRLTYSTDILVDNDWNGSSAEMAEDLLRILEENYQAYTVDFGFLTPSPHLFQDGRLLARLDNDYYESEWSWKTGAIFMTSYYNDKNVMYEEAAHELFHSIQDRYFTTVGMLTQRWWMEATADYAATAVAGQGSYEKIDENYFKTAFFTENGVHEYKSAHFIDYLVEQRGIDFKELWEYIADSWSLNLSSLLDDYLTAEIGADLAEVYRDFARHIFFSTENQVLKSPEDMADLSQMPADTAELERLFKMFPEGTASLWAVEVEMKDQKDSRYLELMLAQDLGDDVFVDIFLANSYSQINEGRPQPEAVLITAGETILLEVPENKTLYVLASNFGANNSEFFVNISDWEPKLTVSPESLSGDYDTEYSFNLKAENIADSVDTIKFAWNFGDDISNDSTNLSLGSKDVEIADQKAEITISHKYLEKGSFELEVILFDKDDQELDRILVPVDIALENEVSIVGARNLTWELADGATETVHSFEAAVQPAGTGEYRFDWDFDDGQTYSETGEASAVDHTYSNLKAGDEFRPKVTLYNLDGEKLAEDSILIEVTEINEQPEVVNFSDPVLEDAIRSNLSKPTGDITTEDMKAVTSLTITKSSLSNLSGLEYGINIYYLDLRENNITSIEPLLSLTKLKKLYLHENGITEIGTLFSDLKELEELRLDNNQIGSVSGEAPASKLFNLSLQDNNLSSVDLRGFPKINNVDLTNNKLSTINLDGFSAVTMISAENNNLSSTAGFKLLQKPNLWRLSLAENQISDLSGVNNLANIEIIDLRDNQVSDISGLSNLPSLETLSLHNNNLTDIDVLLNFDQLAKVYLRENPELITNDDLTYQDVFYPRSPAREVIETLKIRGVDVYFDVVNPY